MDLWVMFDSGRWKTRGNIVAVMGRYIRLVAEITKVIGTLWAVAFVVCTGSTLLGRWPLFSLLVAVATGTGLAGLNWGRGEGRGWLAVTATWAAGATGLLSLLAASGYADSVFALGMLLLALLPGLMFGVLLLPVTISLETLKELFPDGYRTVMSAIRMLLSASLFILIFTAVLLLLPPQNPVAFLLIGPLTMGVAWGAAFSLMRSAKSEKFLSASALVVMGLVFLMGIGSMSMPHLRGRLRTLPRNADRTFAPGPPVAVSFLGSGAIDFVTADGEAKIWYAERVDGGYDLFRSEGEGPCYAPDGRRLRKAEDAVVRQLIAAWVDQTAAVKHESARMDARRKEEAAESAKEAVAIEAAKRAAELEASRRAAYMSQALPASPVGYIVCAATRTGKPLAEFATKLATKLRENGHNSSASIFTPEFTTRGGFVLFFEAKGAKDIQAMPLARAGKRILLACCEVLETDKSSLFAGLFHTRLNISFKVLDTTDGVVIDEFQLNAVSPGNSERDAEAAAFAQILELAQKHYFP